jgi:hypothetical protein
MCTQDLGLAFDGFELGVELGQIPHHQLGIVIAGRPLDPLLLDELLHGNQPAIGLPQRPQHVGLTMQVGEKALAGPRRAGRLVATSLPARDAISTRPNATGRRRMVSRTALHKAADRRYRRSAKGKAVTARYRKSAKGKAANKAAVARYRKSAKGKATAKRYRQSEAGRKAQARARAKAKSKSAVS